MKVVSQFEIGRADPTSGLGDCYTFTAIDRATKLMPFYMLGYRTAECAEWFMADLASRLAGRVQLTTGGLKAYPGAVEKAFGCDVDDAVLNKAYEGRPRVVEAKRRYSPAGCVGATKIVVKGSPEMRVVSTSHVEREPDDAHGHAPVHAADERVHQEDRNAHARGVVALHALQLCAHSQVAQGRTSDGGQLRFALWRWVANRPRLRASVRRMIDRIGLGIRNKSAYMEPLPLIAA